MVCSPKLLSGLGLKNLKLLNLALHMRWKWLELAEEDKPWKGINFDILEEADALFKAATMCVLGDCTKFKFWKDRWMGNYSIREIAPNLMKFVKPTRRNDSVEVTLEAEDWTQSISGVPTVPAIAELMDILARVCDVQLTQAGADSIRWRLMDNGLYSSRTTYKMFFIGKTEVPTTKELWSSGAPIKHKLHMWLALKDMLWTADRLEERGLQHPPQCVLCCQEAETIEHVTLRCFYSRDVRYNLLLSLHLQHRTTAADSVLAI
jgi:hypothetical protein